MISNEMRDKLIAMAREASRNAYVPYSHFKVGAAILGEKGGIYTGCNVENAAYGSTLCAERTALFKAISEGAQAFTAIAIASNGSMPYPCGACRQALNEFAPELRILTIAGDGCTDATTPRALLPHGFGPKDLSDGE